MAESSPQQPRLALDRAKEAVFGPRNRYYGHPALNHQRTADYWNVYVRIELQEKFGITLPDGAELFDAESVCELNILQKISRAHCVTTDDTLVDIAGYAQNIEIIMAQREGRDLIAEVQGR